MSIIQTERLYIRELDSAADAEFIFALLNTPKFLKYIGDRGVRNTDEAAVFIEDRYRQSYRDHGFGLYAVVQMSNDAQIGLCGFVKRDNFDFPDIGFAFLPQHRNEDNLHSKGRVPCGNWCLSPWPSGANLPSPTP